MENIYCVYLMQVSKTDATSDALSDSGSGIFSFNMLKT